MMCVYLLINSLHTSKQKQYLWQPYMNAASGAHKSEIQSTSNFSNWLQSLLLQSLMGVHEDMHLGQC